MKTSYCLTIGYENQTNLTAYFRTLEKALSSWSEYHSRDKKIEFAYITKYTDKHGFDLMELKFNEYASKEYERPFIMLKRN